MRHRGVCFFVRHCRLLVRCAVASFAARLHTGVKSFHSVPLRARSTQDPTAAPVRVLTCPPSRCNWRSGWSDSTAAMATELVTTANPRSFVSSRASARVVVPESSRMVPWPGSSANARSAMRQYETWSSYYCHDYSYSDFVRCCYSSAYGICNQ